MAETHEPSYYEIALTNRQVIVAFVILLTCLLSAFFSGVWIGRESTSRAQERLASAGEQPPKPAPEQGQNMEELEFFGSREDSQSPDDDPAEEPAQQVSGNDTTLLEDFASDEPPAEEPAPVVEEPIEEPEPERVTPTPPVREAPRATEEERPNRRERRNREAERAEEPAAPAARPARTSEPAIPRGSAVIQVFSSADETQAQRIRDQLTKGGYKAYLSPVERGGRTMYRVRIGPYGSRDDAETAAGNVRKSYKLDTWVTE